MFVILALSYVKLFLEDLKSRLERLTVEAYKDVSSLNITTRLNAIDLNDDVFSQSMA